jgi:hypothetical protein
LDQEAKITPRGNVFNSRQPNDLIVALNTFGWHQVILVSEAADSLLLKIQLLNERYMNIAVSLGQPEGTGSAFRIKVEDSHETVFAAQNWQELFFQLKEVRTIS